MAKLLTEMACTNLFVAILGGQYGLDIENYQSRTQRDDLRRKMLIRAKVAGKQFEGELSFDDLNEWIDHARDILTTQLQPQVFAIWQQPQSVEPRQYPAIV